MKKIMMFDTAIASLNMGDEIIRYSLQKNWPELYSKNYIITMPTHTPTFRWWQHYLAKGIRKYSDVDLSFVCGTNLLYTNMIRPNPAWNVFLPNVKLQRGVICIGAGIGANSENVNIYTKTLFRKILSKKYYHSVRDERTKLFLEQLGLKAINTGCPTLWGLTDDLCRNIPNNKSEDVVFTLTEYHSDIESDKLMINILLANYKNLYFWPQSIKDLTYLKQICPNVKIHVIPPNLMSYDRFLTNCNVDYVGNRLHGGIFRFSINAEHLLLELITVLKKCTNHFRFPILREMICHN